MGRNVSMISKIYEAAKQNGIVTVVATAKLIRHRLKSEFPSDKFSVTTRKYSGGASVHVVWSGGPDERTVSDLVKPYQGRTFDAMIDMSVPVTAYLMPDGTAQIAEVRGTLASKGEIGPSRSFKPSPEAVRVTFFADVVLCIRKGKNWDSAA